LQHNLFVITFALVANIAILRDLVFLHDEDTRQVSERDGIVLLVAKETTMPPQLRKDKPTNGRGVVTDELFPVDDGETLLGHTVSFSFNPGALSSRNGAQCRVWAGSRTAPAAKSTNLRRKNFMVAPRQLHERVGANDAANWQENESGHLNFTPVVGTTAADTLSGLQHAPAKRTSA
jgi:hypothetical protein